MLMESAAVFVIPPKAVSERIMVVLPAARCSIVLNPVSSGCEQIARRELRLIVAETRRRCTRMGFEQTTTQLIQREMEKSRDLIRVSGLTEIWRAIAGSSADIAMGEMGKLRKEKKTGQELGIGLGIGKKIKTGKGMRAVWVDRG
ncbi:hypothetical protein V6N12_027314 [Hibiscus sabdariffa]|uniref:Uncharacterized protein n=1 Tax=Hibiscus sabdariffa TaxID=183260 RepID=A0ABR2DUC3_9ROSI